MATDSEIRSYLKPYNADIAFEIFIVGTFLIQLSEPDKEPLNVNLPPQLYLILMLPIVLLVMAAARKWFAFEDL
jgi:hypothetical protein